MLFDYPMFAAAIFCALLIGMAKGGLSGGLGTLVVPILSLSMDPRAAAALTLPILVISDAFAIGAYWRQWNRGHILVLLAGAVIGVALGALTFSWVSEPMMRLLMGLIAIGFVASRVFSTAPPAEALQPPDLVPGMFWGALSGFTSFTAHAGGPPVQIYLLPKGLDKQTFQATVIGFFTLLNLVKVPPYLVLGQFTKPIMITAIMLMPAAAAGVWIGYKLQGMIPEKPFFRVLLVLLFLTGSKLTFDGARGMGWI